MVRKESVRPERPGPPEASLEAPLPSGVKARGDDLLAPPRRAFRDLTKGSVRRNLWFLAWPQMVEGALNMADQVLDLVWAGIISFRAVAGIGVAQSYSQMIMTARSGLDMGMRAMVARAVGVGNLSLANHVVIQAFSLSTVIAVAFALVGILVAEPLLRLIGASEEVIAQGAPYMRFQFLASAGIGLRMMAGAALQAAGDAVTPMKSTMVARAVHVVLSPLLIFGLGGIPSFGIAGAAMASVVAQILGGSVNCYVLFWGRSRLHPTLRGYRPDWPVLGQLMKIGLPASLTAMERSLAQLFLVGLVAPFGDRALAAYSVTRRVEMFSQMSSAGLAQASGILIAQNLGAEQPQRARKTLAWALGYVTCIMVVLGGLLLLFPRPVASIFGRDPELLPIIVVWLQIQALAYLAQGAGVVFMQSLNTAGDTLPPMLVTLGSMWLIELPLAWYWSRSSGLGQFGIAWAMALDMVVRLAFYVPYAFTGRWLRVKVL